MGVPSFFLLKRIGSTSLAAMGMILIMLPMFLLAMYEHSVYVQSVAWGINAFDQFGVELGKTMASNVLRELKLGVEGKRTFDDDTSTNSMLRWCMNNFE